MTIRALAISVSLALPAVHFAHLLHLVAEPHVFCQIHGHFKSTEDRHGHDSGPADSGEHEDEDLACFLAAMSARGEESVLGPVLPVHLSESGVVVDEVSSASIVRDVILMAPKTSPPASFSS